MLGATAGRGEHPSPVGVAPFFFSAGRSAIALRPATSGSAITRT